MELLTDKHEEHIRGILSFFDRIIIQGTLVPFCYSEGMTAFLTSHNIRVFDYAKFAQELREALIANAQQIAKDNNIEIEFIRKKDFRKEDRIAGIIKQRGDHPGLVHIFSALETCTSYKPWHNKKTHRTYLQYDTGKCLHYYFYFIHETLGLCYVRVPTWIPFRILFYFNGHNYLAMQFKKHNISYQLIDNAFITIDDFDKAQKIANAFNVKQLHALLDSFALLYCPIIKSFSLRYHWTITQVEYSTDIVFYKQKYLQNIYDTLVRTAIHTVKPQHIATFLGKNFTCRFKCEMGNNFHTRIQGTRIKHIMGPSSIKMYDKLGIVLRIETSTNYVSFFEHYRKVEHRNGTYEMKVAHMKKNIYNLIPLQHILALSNHRYLEFISSIDDNSLSLNKLDKISKSTVDNNRSFKGFNFFNSDDLAILSAIASGEFNIRGFRNKDLRMKLQVKTTYQICRILKRLRLHGLIRKIAHSFKYYITLLGRQTIAMGLKLRELFIIPNLVKLS